MKNKNTNILEQYLMMGGLPITLSDFGYGQKEKTEEEKNSLGEGLRLVPVPEDELEEYKDDARSNYSYLYKGDEKLSEAFFRKGGSCNGFKDGYCSLIEYDPIDRKSCGIHVIINTDGEVVLEADSISSYPYHVKGIIGSLDSVFYNLETGDIIAKGDTIKSEDFLFIENRYNWDYETKKLGKEIPLGVYKVCYKTGEIEYFK